MKKISIQLLWIVGQFSALVLISSLALSAPSTSTQQSQPQTSTVATTTTSASISRTPSKSVASGLSSTIGSNHNNHHQQQQQQQPPVSLVAVAPNPSGSTPLVDQLRDGATSVAAYEEAMLNTFDGKNPFADDSLWRIPIHLTRDSDEAPNGDAKSSVGPADQLDKSSSEISAANNRQDAMTSAISNSNNNSNNNNNNNNYYSDESHDDEDDLDSTSPLSHQKASSSSAPTVISASTDLKTAAGYHHATPHHASGHYADQHHGGHDAGHYGGHHDHYGKYFQYASVPYPYAWDFGYRRGNPYHTIERYEHGKGPYFQTKVKWADKYGGHGVHVWDYNHDDHHAHHYKGHDHAHYDSHAPTHYGGHH